MIFVGVMDLKPIKSEIKKTIKTEIGTVDSDSMVSLMSESETKKTGDWNRLVQGILPKRLQKILQKIREKIPLCQYERTRTLQKQDVRDFRNMTHRFAAKK